MAEHHGQHTIPVIHQQRMGATDSNITVFVFRQGPDCDAVDHVALDQKRGGLFSVAFQRLGGMGAPPAQQGIPDVDGRVAPGTLRQIHDHLADAAIAFHQQDVAGLHGFPHPRQIVRHAPLIPRQFTGEIADQPIRGGVMKAHGP